jgi:hypothetical protein
METENDYTSSTLLDCAASNRGQGQRGKNCRIGHGDLFSRSLRDLNAFHSFMPPCEQRKMFICPHCGVNVRYQKNWATDEEWAMYFWEKDEEMRKIQQQIDTRYAKKHAGHFLGAREFTLTYSPKWFTDEEARLKMKLAIERLTSYHKTEIVELRAVGEVGKEGNSHIHCYYLLDGGKKIPEKHFKRAYPPWDSKVVLSRTGHKGGHHAEVKSEADFKSYIDKEIDSTWFHIYIDNREK